MKKSVIAWSALVACLLAGCSSVTTDSSSFSLHEKLAREYQRYDKAQQLVLARYGSKTLPLKRQLITRMEWESILAPAAEDTLTTNDLDELRSQQRRQIQQAREDAIRASSINFTSWRSLPAEQSQKQIRAFCEAVPKGGMLHIHPWGSLNQNTFHALLARSNPIIPAENLARELSNPQGGAYLYPDELSWLKSLPPSAPFLALPENDRKRIAGMGVLPPGTHDFERFEAVFNFVALVMGGNWDNIVTAYDHFAERAVRAGVLYVEFTELITPEELPRYEQLADRLEKKYGLVARFNVAFFRTHSISSQHEATKRMLQKINSPIVTGIDLLANERNTPALETAQAIYGPVMAANANNSKQWRRTMHAGEHGDARNPRDALLLGAERLGHGVRLIEDPVALQYAAQKHVPIEVNLTSNLKLKAIDDLRKHPYLTYLRLGLPVSLSTDDEGIYAMDINDDCVLAVSQTDVTYHEFKEMAYNSLRTSFAAVEVKQRLLHELRRRFDRFEQSQKTGSAGGQVLRKSSD